MVKAANNVLGVVHILVCFVVMSAVFRLCLQSKLKAFLPENPNQVNINGSIYPQMFLEKQRRHFRSSEQKQPI